MQNEVWKDVKGFEGLYRISNIGNIRTLRDVSIILKSGKPSSKIEKLLKPGLTKANYSMVVLTKNKIRKNYYVHRLVAMHFISNPENKRTVNHIDFNRSNNIWYNLEWCTQKENINHAWDNGRCSAKAHIGERGNFARLNESQVIEIIDVLRNRNLRTARRLSIKYNVHVSTIYKIMQNKSWKHINRN